MLCGVSQSIAVWRSDPLTLSLFPTFPGGGGGGRGSGPPAVKLSDVISRRALAVVAKNHVRNWRELGPFLELTRQQETEILESYPTNYGLQKRECLEVWKEMKGDGATYQALITAAEEAEERDLADNIRKMTQPQL